MGDYRFGIRSVAVYRNDESDSNDSHLAMTEGGPSPIRCPHCGLHHHWNSAYAGQEVRCPCGHVMPMPMGPPPVMSTGEEKDIGEGSPPSDAETYETEATAADALPLPRRCSSCGTQVDHRASICVNCGLDFAEGKFLKTVVSDQHDLPIRGTDTKPPEYGSPQINELVAQSAKKRIIEAERAADAEHAMRVSERYRPLTLIAIGIVMILVNALVLAPMASEPGGSTKPELAISLLAYAGIRLVVQVPMMLIGLLIVVRLFDTSFGFLVPVLLKLLAIAVVTAGANDWIHSFFDLLTGGWGGFIWMIRLAIVYLFFWGLCSWLLDMEPLEAFVLYISMILLPVFLVLFLAMALGILLF